MASDDPAALAASTAQGWAHTLNATARPAPEHIQAAQEALSALGRADTASSWVLDRLDLDRALMAARARVDGGRPEVTVAQLAEVVGQLRELGLAPQVDQQRAELCARVAELEQELEDTEERRQAALETLARQRARSDQFERERDRERRYLKVAHEARAMDLNAAREDSRRAGYIWCLAQLGNSLPGYDDMPTEELRELAAKRLQEVNLDSGTLRHVTQELLRAERLLSANYEGAPYLRPSQDEPLELAAVVTRLANWSQRRQRELEGQLAELRPDMDLAVVRAERDMLTRARDAQAAELRTLREELAAADRARSELQEALEAERGAPGPSQTRWSDILRERDSHRRRIAELEATLKAERDDDDEPGATLSELRSVRAELAEARRTAAEGAVREETAQRRIAALEAELDRSPRERETDGS